MAIEAVFFDLGETLVGPARSWQPGARELLSHLAQRGLRLGIISNTGQLQDREAILGLLPPDFDLAQFESALVLFSSEVGVQKPELAIFERAVTQAGIPAEKCFYASENALETLAAQAVGMSSLRIISGSTDLANLREWLAQSD